EASPLDIRGAGRRGCGEGVSTEHAVAERDVDIVADASAAKARVRAATRRTGHDDVVGDLAAIECFGAARSDAAGTGARTRGRACGHGRADVVAADEAVGKGELAVVADAATGVNRIADAVVCRNCVAGDRAVADLPDRTGTWTPAVVIAADVN